MDNGYYSLSIHPSKISIWYNSLLPRRRLIPESTEGSSQYPVPGQVPVQFRDNDHQGMMSRVAKGKVTRAIDYLVYLAQPKELPHTLHGKGLKFLVNFVTLSLSSTQVHSDKEIQNVMFEPFLNACRQKWNVTNYIWRKEMQQNGSVHYHIVTDRFIPWNELRNVWNRYQQKLGYIDRYRSNQLAWHADGFRFRPELAAKWSRADQLKAYKKGMESGWDNPNSTDVHSIRLISNVRNYFIKYMTKDGGDYPKSGDAPLSAFDNFDFSSIYVDYLPGRFPDQAQDVTGRLWGCSVNLSKLNGARTDIGGGISDELNKLVELASSDLYSADYFSVISYAPGSIDEIGFPLLFALFESFITEQFPSYRPPTLFT